jgi:hypothetical protein
VRKVAKSLPDGWTEGTVQELLGLTHEEKAVVEKRVRRIEHVHALQAAAVHLSQLLEHLGTFPDEVPRDVWERIAQAGAEIAAAAKALSESDRRLG